MFNRRLLWLLFFAAGTVGVLAFGTAQAYTDLAYTYYDVRGASNYMPVSVTTTASGCIVKPTDEDIFFYDHLDATVPGTNAPDIRPVAATVDKHNVDIKVDIGPFCEPMAVSFSVYAPVLDPEDIWFLDSQYNMGALSDEAMGEGQSGVTSMSSSGKHGHNRFKNLIFWKSKVVEVTQDFKAQLPRGLYVITLSATPSGGHHESYYRWVTLFIVP